MTEPSVLLVNPNTNEYTVDGEPVILTSLAFRNDGELHDEAVAEFWVTKNGWHVKATVTIGFASHKPSTKAAWRLSHGANDGWAGRDGTDESDE